MRSSDDDRPATGSQGLKVAVTGAGGMLGSHLVRRLADEGYEVLGVDIRAGAATSPAISQVVADVRDTPRMARLLAGADVVVHCAAALPSYPADEIRSVIVDGTRSLFAAARTARVARVVHISSTAVYGLPSVVPTPEDYPHRPVDAYSAAKSEAEAAAVKFRDEDLCVAVLRPKTFLGPGRMGLFAMLFEWAEQGHNFPVLGSGNVLIQMLDMDDLLDAIMLALNAPPDVANHAYNIGAAEFGTIRDAFQAVLDAAGHGKRVVSVPARPTVGVLQALGRLRLSPVYARLVRKLLDDSYVSIERARDDLGFEPRHSNRDAILRTFRWWQAQHVSPAQADGRRTSREPWRQGALSLAKAFF